MRVPPCVGAARHAGAWGCVGAAYAISRGWRARALGTGPRARWFARGFVGARGVLGWGQPVVPSPSCSSNPRLLLYSTSRADTDTHFPFARCNARVLRECAQGRASARDPLRPRAPPPPTGPGPSARLAVGEACGPDRGLCCQAHPVRAHAAPARCAAQGPAATLHPTSARHLASPTQSSGTVHRA